jgi:hypothetical protein
MSSETTISGVKQDLKPSSTGIIEAFSAFAAIDNA